MSYGLYIGKNLTSDGHAWLAGYGDEPSSHWLEIIPAQNHEAGETIPVGVGPEADLPGVRFKIPQAQTTARHIRVSYSYYKGVPAPITNGGLNEHGVAVRDIWSTSRHELIAMTPSDQRGLNYSDLARMVIEQAKTAREAVVFMGDLIAQYGEASYGGNSHLIADSQEAWVVIQFAGGKGLWAAERLGDDSVRASRPGYILEVPVEEPNHPDFLFSKNFFSFAITQGWYESGPFNVNEVYGDGKARWAGVKWIEGEMRKRVELPGKITFEDMVWALRTSKLTGDTAGYGQIVPLIEPKQEETRMLWHAAIGPVAAPFSPVFMWQDHVPPEYSKHRYLTTGEAHRFLDTRLMFDGPGDSVSHVSQYNEMFRSAVYESKRLLYLMLQDKDNFAEKAHNAFNAREARLAEEVASILEEATALIDAGKCDEGVRLLENFSTKELLGGLDLVQSLSSAFETRVRQMELNPDAEIKMFDQIW